MIWLWRLLGDSFNYDLVKMAILCAYELVPKAYRQKFRHHKKNVEFVREKGTLFDRWSNACKANYVNLLRELILLEDFKKCLPEHVVIY